MTTVESPPEHPEHVSRLAPAARRAAVMGRALQRLEPPTGHPDGVLDLRFSGPGLTMASFFAAASLQPSLLPRSALLQGLISGVSLTLGYGVGTLFAWVWRYLGIPQPHGRLRRWLVGITVTIGLALTALAGWQQVGWQNDLRALYGMEPIGPEGWPVIVTTTLLVAAPLLVVTRTIGSLFSQLRQRLNRRMSRPLATLLGGMMLLVVFWAIYTGVLVNGFFAIANAVAAPADRVIPPGLSAPTSAQRSGGPGSAVDWSEMGFDGRNFVSGGPSATDIEKVTGTPAMTPVRVYVGLRNAPTLQQRADLVLAELKRTGAFDRKVLVIATTTGTGYLDQNGTDPLEYLWNGDTAIAGVQYSYLPSWISLLADQEAVQQTSTVVFDTIHDYWATLPADHRPKIYLYGLSLGSYGVEQVLGSINLINEPVSGALLVGPPFVNTMHAQLVADRDPGSPAWLPIYGQGRTVRFTAEQDGLDRTTGPWGPTRLVYLQHASDPVVFFSSRLAFTPPEWLADGQRGPDVSPRMGWFPLVTMAQVLVDLPDAGNVPMGYGHLYSATANLRSWDAITEPSGWTSESLAALGRMLDARPHPYGGG